MNLILVSFIHSFYLKVREAKSLGAVRINSHSGSDTWSMDQNLEFFRAALKIEEEEGILVTHETHRRRILYNPWITRDVLKQLPQLKVNADFSHWVCVAERLFDDKLDDDWPEILEITAKSVYLIHARVGYCEGVLKRQKERESVFVLSSNLSFFSNFLGPQVTDPSAPEFQAEWNAHLSWWTKIIEKQRKNGIELYIEPEHGPAPYLHTLPHTQMPVANLWEVNSWIAKQLQSKFEMAIPSKK